MREVPCCMHARGASRVYLEGSLPPISGHDLRAGSRGHRLGLAATRASLTARKASLSHAGGQSARWGHLSATSVSVRKMVPPLCASETSDGNTRARSARSKFWHPHTHGGSRRVRTSIHKFECCSPGDPEIPGVFGIYIISRSCTPAGRSRSHGGSDFSMDSPDSDPDPDFSPRSVTALRAPSSPSDPSEPCPRETCHCDARSAVTAVALHKASTRNLITHKLNQLRGSIPRG